MNSGLYAFAGASATATAAACANRLLEPMTKVSKVYFGFSRAGSTRPAGRPPAADGDGQCIPGMASSTACSDRSPPASDPIGVTTASAAAGRTPPRPPTAAGAGPPGAPGKSPAPAGGGSTV